MRRKCKGIISYLLICAMVWAMIPSLPAKAAKGTNLVPTIEDGGQVTFYYQGDGTETEVYVKGSWDSSWGTYFYMQKSENDFWSVTSTGLSADRSYEYGIVVNGTWVSNQPNKAANGSNPKIIRNPVVNADGTVTFYYYPSEGEAAADLQVTYTDADGQSSYKGFAADASYPTIYSATTEPLNGTYTYLLSLSGNDIPGYNSNTSTFTASAAPAVNPDVVSPVVNGSSVSFNYYGPTVSEVKLAGSMTNWGDGAQLMTYNSTTGYWSITLTNQLSGNYQYKFIVDGGWFTDPLNMVNVDGNSAYTITDGYVPDVVSPQVDGKTVTFYYKGAETDTVLLAGSMTDWQNGAKTFSSYDAATELWSLTLRLEPGNYEYKFIVNGDWITDPAHTQKSNGNSAFTVAQLPEGTHTYNIYYYDKNHTGLKDAALWLWEDNGAGGKEYHFIGQETIDGYTWLKAELDLAFDSIGVIPKNYSQGAVEWNWQDATRNYDFSGAQGARDIYLVFGDATAYEECPDLSAISNEDRYVVVEYTRPDGNYQGWNIYTWNSGYGSDVSVNFENVNGKMLAKIPVTPAVTELSFCMRRSEAGSDWAEKDGGDHSIKIPQNQTVAKARFMQDQGVVETLPYNKGYEIQVADKTVTFYYRDNSYFRDFTQEELAGKVKVCIDNDQTKYDMTYDTKTERYIYVYDGLTEGEHTYCYFIDGEQQVDAYNSRLDDSGKWSIYEYYSFDAQVEASLAYASMDYNDNNVITVSMKDDQGQTVSDLEAVEVSVDLTSLGGGIAKVDTQLMAMSFGVRQDTVTGNKNLPITVKDQYGNIYTGNVAVNVVAREKGNDFDWDEAVIYFAVTDRFFDGNADNNDAYGLGDYNIGANGSSSYHGGDFAGLTQKLDYLQELGVNTVWITPIVENYMADGLATDVADIKSYGYHGYWASDFEKLNKHLGTEAELQTLIDELHSRGMKLMVDVVLNHSGYDTDGKNITGYFNGLLNGKNMLRNASNTVAGSEVLDSLAGLPDFATEDAEVRDLLISWQSAWVSEYDIDYFRVDTVKHVEDTTWAAFKNELTQIDPTFKMIGEQSGAGYATSAGKLRTGEMDSLLDFDFNDKAIDFTTGKLSEVESFLQKRNAGIDNTATMGSFLSSHDEDGLRYRLQDEKNMNEADSYAAMKVAAALQITAKGQPVIYYGEEIGLTGANNYPYQTNRYDFDWSEVNENNTMLEHYQKLLSIRQDYSDVFAKGNRSSVLVSDELGYDVFSRSYNNTTLCIALQNKDKAQSVSISFGKAGEKVKDLYSGTEYTVDAEGKVEITIPAAANGGCAVLKVIATSPVNPVNPDPVNPATQDNGAQELTVDWNQIATGLTEKLAAKNSGANNVWNIITGKNIVVPKKEIQTLAGKNLTLAMHTGDNLAFSITGKDILKAAEGKDLNLALQSDKSTIPLVQAAEKSKEAVTSRRISMLSRDKFGMTVNMHLALGSENAGLFANLYRYDEQKGKLVYAGSFQITDKGQAMFGITQGADYLVTVTKVKSAEKAAGDYIVSRGDTMSNIAARFGISLQELALANLQIRNINNIRMGQSIIIP